MSGWITTCVYIIQLLLTLWLIWKYLDAGKDWRQGEKGMAEDKMVGWHHWLKEDEFEQALGVGDGQGGLACCGPWGLEELDTIKWLNWTDISINIFDKKKTICFYDRKMEK